MTLTIEELKRRIILKKQLVAWTLEDIAELERKKALAETEQDEKPCKVWLLNDLTLSGGANVQG